MSLHPASAVPPIILGLWDLKSSMRCNHDYECSLYEVSATLSTKKSANDLGGGVGIIFSLLLPAAFS